MKKMNVRIVLCALLISMFTAANSSGNLLEPNIEPLASDSTAVFVSIPTAPGIVAEKYIQKMLPPVQQLWAVLAADDAVLLQWDMNPPQGQWIQWCSDLNANQIGLTDGGTIHVAAHWLPGQLPAIENPAINRIAFFPISDLGAIYTLKVYQGENAESLLLSYPVPNYTQGLWNEYSIEPPLEIDLSQELWVGYEVTHAAGDYPAGCDQGPAVTGYGDMFSLDGQNWEALSIYGLNFNWNIKVSIISLEEDVTDRKHSAGNISSNHYDSSDSALNQPLKSNKLLLNGFNVYRNDNLIAQLPLQLDYLDQNLSTGTYVYTVVAVYVGGNADPSPPAQIYVPGVSMAQISFEPEELIAYHNPPMITTETLMVTNTGSEPLSFNISIEYNPIAIRQEKSLCTDNLYSSGCGFGDGIVSWQCANIEIPGIPCIGSPPWYQNFTNYHHNFTPGQPYLITVKAGYSQTYFDVWIDWNNDSVLNNSDELMVNDGYCPLADVPYNFVLAIPDDVPGGSYTMRIRTNWQNYVNDPCETYTYGNCIDFSVYIEGNIYYNWLSAMPTSGTIAPGAQFPVMVTFNTTEILPGIYNGALKFSSSAPGSPHFVPAKIIPCIPMCFFPQQYSFTANHNSPPQITSQSLSLFNSCSYSVNFSIVVPDKTVDEYEENLDLNTSETATWLSIEPNSGTVEPGRYADLTLIFNSSGLTSPGAYNSSIIILNNSFYPHTLPITLNLTGCGYPSISNLNCSYTTPETVELAWMPPDMETLRRDNGVNFTRLSDPINYKVYRNSELIATLPATSLTYTDNQAPMQLLEYAIGAVYDECEALSDACSPAPISWIQVEPESFNVELIIGETMTDQFNIQNTGHPSALMDFQIEVNYVYPKSDSKMEFSDNWLTVTPANGQIAGQSAESITITVDATDLGIGDYYCFIQITTDAQNLQFFDIPVMLDITTSIDERDKMCVQIYPNPTDGVFTIAGVECTATVRIINAMGVNIFMSALQLPATIDLSSNPKGIYYFQLNTDEETWFSKLNLK